MLAFNIFDTIWLINMKNHWPILIQYLKHNQVASIAI